jgi:hypothetical protein
VRADLVESQVHVRHLYRRSSILAQTSPSGDVYPLRHSWRYSGFFDSSSNSRAILVVGPNAGEVGPFPAEGTLPRAKHPLFIVRTKFLGKPRVDPSLPRSIALGLMCFNQQLCRSVRSYRMTGTSSLIARRQRGGKGCKIALLSTLVLAQRCFFFLKPRALNLVVSTTNDQQPPVPRHRIEQWSMSSNGVSNDHMKKFVAL